MTKHGTTRGYRNGCRCADCTEAKRADCARYLASYKQRKGEAYVPPSRPRRREQCLGCGGEVRGAYKKDSPWHRPCREKSEQAARAAARKRRRAAAKLTKAATGSGSRWVWTEGPCGWCGERFCHRGNTAAKFCSGRCKSKSKARGFKIRPTERLAIYERDGWTCQLCSEPVDPDLHYLDDWAASLDHIECQAWSLIPDHSPANLRLAHRWCNSVRGDETWFTEADLRVPTAA